MAVWATPKDHPNQPALLNHLWNILLAQYNWTGNLHNLEAIISKAELVVSIASENYPNQGKFLDSQGCMLLKPYKRTRNMHDLQATISKAE